jgi:hypothetical protein
MSTERQWLTGDAGVFGKSLPTDEQKLLLKEIQKLEETMIHRKKHMGYTPQENQAFFEKELFEIKERYYFRSQAVADEFREKLEEARIRHLAERQKRVAEDALDLQRWQLRYGALSKDALIEEAQKYLHEGGFSPDRLDVLNAALVKAGVKKVGYSQHIQGENAEGSGPVTEKPFGAWIEERHGREPYLEQNPELVKSLELYDQPFGSFRILGENGQFFQFDIDGAYMERTDGEN